MPKKPHSPTRNPLEDTVTVSMPVALKAALYGRSALLERYVSPLVRWAVEHQESVGWKDCPKALLAAVDEKKLAAWLKSVEGLSWVDVDARLDQLKR